MAQKWHPFAPQILTQKLRESACYIILGGLRGGHVAKSTKVLSPSPPLSSRFALATHTYTADSLSVNIPHLYLVRISADDAISDSLIFWTTGAVAEWPSILAAYILFTFLHLTLSLPTLINLMLSI